MGRNRRSAKFSQHNKETLLIHNLFEKCLGYSTENVHTVDELFDEFCHLYDLIGEICKLQDDRTKNILIKNDREVNINNFINWCKTYNLYDENLFKLELINPTNEEYGLRSLKDLNENDLIFKIPRKYMLTLENALNDANLGPLIKKDSILKTMPNISLSMFVLEEKCKGKDSFWYAYLDACPRLFNTTLFYNKEEMNLLKKSPAFELAVKMFRNICRQYSYFYQNLNLPTSNFNKLKLQKYFTFDLYRWSTSIVMTRQNYIKSGKNDEMINCLIPLWDMMNHENGKISTELNLDSDEAICYAMRAFKKGEELKIFYGSRSNVEFLIHNGFVYESNLNDYLLIKIGISKMDKLYMKKLELLNKLEIPTSGFFKLKHKTCDIDEKLLVFLRVFHFDECELDYYLQQNHLYVDLFKTNDKRFEVIDFKIQGFLSIRAQLLLRNYSFLNQENDSSSVTFKMNNTRLLLTKEQKILQSHVLNN